MKYASQHPLLYDFDHVVKVFKSNDGKETTFSNTTSHRDDIKDNAFYDGQANSKKYNVITTIAIQNVKDKDTVHPEQLAAPQFASSAPNVAVSKDNEWAQFQDWKRRQMQEDEWKKFQQWKSRHMQSALNDCGGGGSSAPNFNVDNNEIGMRHHQRQMPYKPRNFAGNHCHLHQSHQGVYHCGGNSNIGHGYGCGQNQTGGGRDPFKDNFHGGGRCNGYKFQGGWNNNTGSGGGGYNILHTSTLTKDDLEHMNLLQCMCLYFHVFELRSCVIVLKFYVDVT